MKKFAANYLVTESGEWIKNGIIVATEVGDVVEIIDQGEDLREIEQLTFFNGILFTNFRFVRIHSDLPEKNSVSQLESLIIQLATDLNEVSIQIVIEAAMQIHVQFPEMTIPQIFTELSNSMFGNGNFSRINLPGIYLLSSVNLSERRFTPRSKLKKIL